MLTKLKRVLAAVKRKAAGPAGTWVSIVALGVLGGCIGILLAGNIKADVGPFQTTFSVQPSFAGRSHVELAPLGSLSMRTHDGPARLDVKIDRVDLPAAQALLNNPQAVDQLENDVAKDARTGVTRLAWRSLLVAGLGGAALALLRRPHWKTALIGGGTALAVVGASFGFAAATFRPQAIAEPRFTGLLTLAPQAIGDVREATTKFSAYREQVNELAANLSRLYQSTESVAVPEVDANTIRILQVSDLHLNPAAFDLIDQLVLQFKPAAVIDNGDINDWGTTFEGPFVERIGKVGVPYIYIRGNHDSLATQAAVAAQPNAIVLDNATTTVEGIRIWGIGDSRFTADKSTYENKEQERSDAQAAAPQVFRSLLSNVPPRVDVALVHDPATAADLDGAVPLVLAGHLHKFEQRQLGADTTMIVQGSTGAAGLRGVAETGESTPLQSAILYFDRTTHRLKAYDEITVAGLGDSGGANIDRHVVNIENKSESVVSTTTTSATNTTAVAR